MKAAGCRAAFVGPHRIQVLGPGLTTRVARPDPSGFIGRLGGRRRRAGRLGGDCFRAAVLPAGQTCGDLPRGDRLCANPGQPSRHLRGRNRILT